MNKNVKIAKELMKIAELLINKTNEDEMFEKLYDKNLDVNHRQEIINYFMKTREGLETLCFDDFDVLYDNEREMVLKAASNNEDFDDYCFVTMLKTKQYKNNNEKNIMLNAIINDEYCMDLMKDHNGHGLKILSFNLFHFSVGFYGEMNGKKAFFYITKSYDRFFYLED
jgi:hypothetical protein